MDKLKKKYIKKSKISLITNIVIFIISIALYSKFKISILTIIALTAVLLNAIIVSIYGFLSITIDARSMWKDYNSNHNLKSGAIVIILMTVLPMILLLALSNTLPDEWKDIFNTIITTLITLMPALISLLGIHYSNTMQQINKTEELRNANKPYPHIEYQCTSIKEKDDNISVIFDMSISNLASNMLIPLYLKHNDTQIDFAYKSATDKLSAVFTDISIVTRKNSSCEFSIVYKDTLENIYKSKFTAQLNKGCMISPDLQEAVLISNK